MRRNALLIVLLLLTTARAIYSQTACGDRGDSKRRLVYVQEGQEANEDAPVLKLLPRCRFMWQQHEGTYSYCNDCNNGEADLLLFEHATLPWGQAAVLQRDTDLVFAHQVHGQTVITTLKLRRGWSLCPLWPICTGRP